MSIWKFGDGRRSYELATRKLEKERELGRTQKVLGTRSDVSRNVQAKVLLGTLGMMVGRIVEARKVG